MPINDAQRFNERTAAAMAVARGALATSVAILAALRERGVLSHEECAIIAQAALDGAGGPAAAAIRPVMSAFLQQDGAAPGER